jgi:hypothetical protein
MRLSPPRDVGLLLARQHHAVADREQDRVDSIVGMDSCIQRADRIGVGIVMIGIANAAGP